LIFFLGMKNRLKILRKEHGFTLKSLSLATGIGVSTIGNFETGKYPMSRAFLDLIAKTLGVNVQEVLTAEPPSPVAETIREDRAPYTTAAPVLDDGTALRYISMEALEAAHLAAVSARDWPAAAALASVLASRTTQPERKDP
jgi:transcriptional regulator with XRE-family HTH domain